MAKVLIKVKAISLSILDSTIHIETGEDPEINVELELDAKMIEINPPKNVEIASGYSIKIDPKSGFAHGLKSADEGLTPV